MMNKQFYIAAALSLAASAASAQQCTVLHIDHFGGNKSDGIVLPHAIRHVDMSFSLPALTISTEGGEILKSCPDITGTTRLFITYSVDGTLISQRCAPKGTDFEDATFFEFPREGGDTVIVGASALDAQGYAIERRGPDGAALWTKHYGSSNAERFVSAVPAADGGYFIVGESYGGDGDVGLHYGDNFTADIWVLRLDSNGDKLWSRVLGGSEDERASAVIAAEDGGCYVFGETVSDDHDATGLHGAGDVYVARLDAGGNKLWHRCYGGTESDGTGDVRSIRPVADGSGGFYIPASTASSDGDVQQRVPEGFDYWLLHIDSLGNILWENTYGGPHNEFVYSLCRATDGSFWLGGMTYGGGGQVYSYYGMSDGWVAHADSNGIFLNSRAMGGTLEEGIAVITPLVDDKVLAFGSYNYLTASVSPYFPTTNWGDRDVFLAYLSPDNDLAVEQLPIEDKSWSVYPNPSDQEITVTLPAGSGPCNIAVYSVEGKELAGRRSSASPVTISTTGLIPGTYTIMLTDRYGRSGSKKIVISR